MTEELSTEVRSRNCIASTKIHELWLSTSHILRDLIANIVHQLCHLPYQWWTGTGWFLRCQRIAGTARWTTRWPQTRRQASRWIGFATIIWHFHGTSFVIVQATVFAFQSLSYETEQHFATIVTERWRLVRMYGQRMRPHCWDVIVIIGIDYGCK